MTLSGQSWPAVACPITLPGAGQALGWHQDEDGDGPRTGEDVALLWGMGEQPCHDVAGARADGLEGLT